MNYTPEKCHRIECLMHCSKNNKATQMRSSDIQRKIRMIVSLLKSYRQKIMISMNMIGSQDGGKERKLSYLVFLSHHILL